MQHLFALSALLATGLATQGVDTQPTTLTVRLQVTVQAPLEVQVLNDSEQNAAGLPTMRVRVFRGLNTGAMSTVSVAEPSWNKAS